MRAYVLSPAAERDLIVTLRAGIRNFGAAQAFVYQETLEQAFRTLAAFPQMARERKRFRPAIRVHHHGRHYIVYRVREKDIRILRVLQDDADLGRHLRRIR